MDDLNERKLQILQAIIADFISTGSKTFPFETVSGLYEHMADDWTFIDLSDFFAVIFGGLVSYYDFAGFFNQYL